MSYSKNEVLIDVKGVHLSYDKPILRDVNFQVHNIVRPGLNQERQYRVDLVEFLSLSANTVEESIDGLRVAGGVFSV